MSDRRPIVVVADDLGLRAEWDTAIFAAHDRGFVQAVSVVANGPRYGRVLPALKQRPRLEVGAHLNVYEGAPISPASEVPSLRMTASVAGFVAAWSLRRVSAKDVATEWRRQVARLFEDGLSPCFLNSHYHLHMLPDLFEVALGLAREFGIRHVRVTDEPPWLAVGNRPGRLRRLARIAPLWGLGLSARRRIESRGLPPAPGTRGLGASEALGPPEWRSILAEPGNSPIEIVCHPGQSPQQREALESTALLDELRQRALPFSFRS